MKIHEYQAKAIFRDRGIPVPRSMLARTADEAAKASDELAAQGVETPVRVVKAQVHAGGRGKAGGVKICAAEDEIQEACEGMFGRKLITHQTGPDGKGIYRVFVEAAVPIEREIYLGLVLDRSSQRVMIVASGEGGMLPEEKAANSR